MVVMCFLTIPLSDVTVVEAMGVCLAVSLDWRRAFSSDAAAAAFRLSADAVSVLSGLSDRDQCRRCVCHL